MATMRYYYDLRSQPCRSLYIFLKANDINFETVHVDLFAGEQLEEKFTKVNPYKRVPVIDDDGFVLSESIAILHYLSQKHNVPRHWFPQGDIKQEARLQEYLHWHHANIRYITMMLFRHEYINTMRGRAVKQDEVEQFKGQFAKTINHLDQYFLADKPFICGQDMSVADVMAICELTQLLGTGNENLYLSNPKINAWQNRVRERLQPHFDEAHESIRRMRTMYQEVKSSKM